jgi:hypothetical protein
MPESLKRRDFIKTASVFGASIAIGESVSSNNFLPDGSDEIRNNYFRVSFDKKKGNFNIFRNNGAPLLTGGTIRANSSLGKLSTASENYRHTIRSATINNVFGLGKKLIISSSDAQKKLNIEIHFSLYDQLESVVIEVICTNVSIQDVIINSLEPARVIENEGGILHVTGVSKCITNGEMYYDTGKIYEFGTNDKPESPGYFKGVKLANNSLSSKSETIHSWWNAGLFSGYDKEALALGWLENNLCLGNLLISKTDTDEISFLAESVYAPNLTLKAGKSVSSNRLMINIAGNPYTSLENYAEAVGKINKARTHSIINGWCSWFYTLAIRVRRLHFLCTSNLFFIIRNCRNIYL